MPWTLSNYKYNEIQREHLDENSMQARKVAPAAAL